MELSDILALLDRFDASSASSMKLRLGDLRLELNTNAAPAAVAPAAVPVVAAPAAVAAPVPAAEAPKAQAEGTTVKAPLVGTFYAAPAPGEEAFAAPGKQVKKGETLCLIEAMKMMSEITATDDCEVEEV